MDNLGSPRAIDSLIRIRVNCITSISGNERFATANISGIAGINRSVSRFSLSFKLDGMMELKAIYGTIKQSKIQDIRLFIFSKNCLKVAIIEWKNYLLKKKCYGCKNGNKNRLRLLCKKF